MPKNKGKSIATSSRGEGDEPQPRPKRARRTEEAPKSKKKGLHTPANRMARMKAMDFQPTRWVDHLLLRELGLYEDVERVFYNMGLRGLFLMNHESHKTETMEFLASMKFEDDTSLDVGDDGRGILTFTVNKKHYKLSANHVAVIFDATFDANAVTLELDDNEAQGVWTTIAQGTYEKGASKAAGIRHPAIRYAHKFLANTLFARRETGNVKEDELALIIEGIKPLLLETSAGEDIIGQTRTTHFGHYIIRRLLAYQEWVVTHKDHSPILNIGGIITPILKEAEVPLGVVDEEPRRIDLMYLATARMIVGRVANRYCYRFLERKEKKLILLPKNSATSLEDRENIIFRPQPPILYDQARDGPLIRIRPPKPNAPQPEDEDEGPQEEPIYGSHRYDFTPYAVPVASEALRKAHEHIGLLRRGFKWQGRQIKKMVRTIKKQGAIIKRLLKGQSPHRPTANQEEEDRQLALALAEEEERGQGCGSSRGKGKAPISPSSSDSGNPSYDMEESSSGSPLI